MRPAPAGDPAAVAGDPGVGRAALAVAVWNLVSRITGFVRVVAVGAALGTTFLGNTYQSANLVSNVVFELLAAGLLAAPLVPAFVRHLAAGARDQAERLAGSLLGFALAGLAVVAVLLAGGGTLVMGALTAGSPPEVRPEQVRLGAFLMFFFAPQVLLYAVGAVATALLHARSRFAAAAFAPAANNVVVIVTMAVFAVLTEGRPPSLDLATEERLVLAVGTTAGVATMAAVPLFALRRSGLRLRPRLDAGAPGLRRVVRDGAWGGVLLAAMQVLVAASLVLANQVEGGVVAYQIAFTFFLLPFALIAHPVFTTLYPRLAAHAARERWDGFAAGVRAGLSRVTTLVLPASAVLGAVGWPALRVVRLGSLDDEGVTLIARVLAAYCPGLTAYAWFHLLARAATAAGDARLPAVVATGAAAAGVILMVGTSSAARGDGRVVALGVAHSVTMVAAAGLLAGLLQRRLAIAVVPGAAVARAAFAAAASLAVAVPLASAVGGSGRVADAMAVAVAGLAGAGASLAVLWVLRSPELRAVRGGR